VGPGRGGSCQWRFYNREKPSAGQEGGKKNDEKKPLDLLGKGIIIQVVSTPPRERWVPHPLFAKPEKFEN